MTVYKAKHIKDWDCTTPAFNNGPWVPARPLVWWRFIPRLKAAWDVFTGKYDALDWSFHPMDERLKPKEVVRLYGPPPPKPVPHSINIIKEDGTIIQ